MSKELNFRNFICVGFSKSYNKEEYLDAVKNAIEDYIMNENINITTNVIVIIKSYGDLELSKANKIIELVKNELHCAEICFNYRVLEDENIKDQIEIILVGM